MIEVQFIKVIDIDSTYWRFTPFFKNFITDEEKDTHLREWEAELDFYKKNAVLKEILEEEHWEKFLEHYYILEIQSNSMDSEMIVYKKKANLDINSPTILIKIIAAEVDVKIPDDTKFLKSHPVPGRLNEYIIIQGEIEFNTGDFTNKKWCKRNAVSEDIQRQDFIRKYKKLKEVEEVGADRSLTVYQMRTDEKEMFVVDTEREDDFSNWFNKLEKYQSSKLVEKGIYRHTNGKLFYALGIAVHLDTFEEFVIYQALYADMKFYARKLDDFLGDSDTEKYPNNEQSQKFLLVSK